MRKRILRVIWLVLMASNSASPQTSPQSLADSVLEQWSSGSATEFASLYPFRDGRDLHANLVREKVERVKGLSSVIRATDTRALLLLSGVPLTGNSGDATIYSMMFSGPYEVRLDGERWRLDRRVPLDEMGQILSHDLRVSIRPAAGVDVIDRITIRTRGENGFATRLNYRAQLRRVEAGGRALRYQFGGGLLWLDTPSSQLDVTLDYTLPVETKTANSGCFLEAFGHLRNQYFWHPFFDFGSSSDQAEFHIELRIPKDYRATTSLPQTDHIEGDVRVIEGKTVQPSHALTLAYDRDWKEGAVTAGKTRLELFLTPEFRPDADAVTREFRDVYGQLSRLFGEPEAGYIAIVQLRGDSGDYWHFNSNHGVFAAGSPGYVSTIEGHPNANLGHEIGHLWTDGTGPAANFLREGWATYVESLVLQREFGPTVVRTFWEYHEQKYLRNYDGKVSILEETANTDLNYDKGSWIFRMLEPAVGREAFLKAMNQYSRRSRAAAADWLTLADCFQQQNVPGFDARRFLEPWLKEKSVPRITSRIEGDKVTLHQDGPYFPLAVTVEATTAKGVERRAVEMRAGDASVDFPDTVSNVQIDPDHLLLLKR